MQAGDGQESRDLGFGLARFGSYRRWRNVFVGKALLSSERAKTLYDSRQVWRERRPNETRAGFREKKRHFFL